MRLIVGLGNPGARYEMTRHNLGFLVVDELARQMQTTVEKEECHALTAATRWRGHRLLLAKPQTFMNRSGEAVAALLHYYRIPACNMLVVYDDLALPPGRLRLRPKGSAGGHNGLRSIIHYVRTDVFPRLRIGIGPVPPEWTGADYVLSAFGDDAPLYERAVGAAADAVSLWLAQGMGEAMSVVNAHNDGQKPNSSD